jgi:hypothetical protein
VGTLLESAPEQDRPRDPERVPLLTLTALDVAEDVHRMTTTGWNALRELMVTRCSRHSPRLDSFLYNGGTAAVLLATALATFLPTTVDPDWLPRALSGFAAFWIGLERALNFGGRWRYHRGMQVGYENVIGKIDLYTASRDELTPEEARAQRDEIVNEIDVLQHREADIPSGEAPPSPPKK